MIILQGRWTAVERFSKRKCDMSLSRGFGLPIVLSEPYECFLLSASETASKCGQIPFVSAEFARKHRDLRFALHPSPAFHSLAMNAQALQARLTPLFDSLKQTQQLITRLSKLPATPGSSPSNSEEADARVELSAEIHQSLKEQEEEFELLRQEVEDQTNTSSWSSNARRKDSGKEREKTDLAAQVTRLGEDLKMYRLYAHTPDN